MTKQEMTQALDNVIPDFDYWQPNAPPTQQLTHVLYVYMYIINKYIYVSTKYQILLRSAIEFRFTISFWECQKCKRLRLLCQFMYICESSRQLSRLQPLSRVAREGTGGGGRFGSSWQMAHVCTVHFYLTLTLAVPTVKRCLLCRAI